ncbi:MAG: Slp family lipoprotein [Rudaea sp.]
MRVITAALAITTVALSAGCASVPTSLVGTNFATITPQQAATQPAGSQRVRWGGEILRVEPRANATCFEILSRELYPDARPNRRDHSEGRFIACKAGFFDPAVYAKGRDITIVGALNGNERHKVGEFDYTFAKVDADEVYMWPRRAEFVGSYYDPFLGPGCDPFWGSCFGWGGYGYWGPRAPIVIVKPRPPKT